MKQNKMETIINKLLVILAVSVTISCQIVEETAVVTDDAVVLNGVDGGQAIQAGVDTAEAVQVEGLNEQQLIADASALENQSGLLNAGRQRLSVMMKLFKC